jgi:dTDP-4-dehydrorhamnose 3,5-epimerase
MIWIKRTDLDGVLIVTPDTQSLDHRGMNVESFNDREYECLGTKFIVDSISSSRKDVLRGIHGDSRTTKLISVLFGEIYFVVVNLDKDSPQYTQSESFYLSASNYRQILVPPKFGNAHLVISDYAVFSYKLSAEYDRDSQFSVHWNTPMLDIWWPSKKPILSERDEKASECLP